MSYCLNSDCQNPQNPDGTGFCLTCGSKLSVKDRYRAIALLGQGAFGRTYLAVDQDQPAQPSCAIKQFLPQDASTPSLSPVKGGGSALFRIFASRLDELGKHPHIPKLWASFEEDGHQYLVQEYIEGENLARSLANSGTFSESNIRKLLKDILPVLAFVHDRQMIHGDIKPENIIRRRSDSRLVLVDFGDGSLRTGFSFGTQGPVSGSAEYAAPEQTKGQATSSSDLYSLGVTCIYLLTQVSPFDMFDIKADAWVWRDYLKTPVSYSLGQILDKMVQRSSKQRYQSADEVLKDLNSWMLPPVSPRQKRLAVSALGGAALALLVGNLTSRVPAPVPQTALMPPEVLLAPPEIGYSTPYMWDEIQPLRTIEGNNGPFWTVAVSPDGQTVAGGSYDGTIQLRQLNTGQLTNILAGHSGAVWSVAISPDSEILASGGEDKTVKLWNPNTGQLLHTLTSHSGAVLSVAISADSQKIASVSEDKTVKLWNAHTGKLLRTLRGHTADVQSVAFSPDGKMLVTGSTDGTVKLWSARSGKLRRTLIGHGEAVWSVAVSPDGQKIASGSWDRTVKIWDLKTGELLNTFTGHSDKVWSVAFSPDGQTVASGDSGGTIKLWQPDTGTERGTLKGHSSEVKLAFSPVGKTLVSGSFDDTIKLWRLCP
jgi:WD40 repeat protein